MKRHLIHTEFIRKAGAKIQFQVRLPRKINQITGIQLSLIRQGAVSPVPVSSSERGSLRLRIPERRDVFYSENTFYPTHSMGGYYDFGEVGIGAKQEWWFKGERVRYYKTDIPLSSTFIEGFYEDQSNEPQVDYQLRIYFKLNDYTE